MFAFKMQLLSNTHGALRSDGWIMPFQSSARKQRDNENAHQKAIWQPANCKILLIYMEKLLNTRGERARDRGNKERARDRGNNDSNR